MTNIIEDSNISILINHKRGLYNDKNWMCIKKRYEFLIPNGEIVIGDYPKDNYSKSLTINNAAKRARGDIFIIADSNIAFNFESIKKGLDMLKQYPFIVPYEDVIYLNQHSTRDFYTLSPKLNMNGIRFSVYKREPASVGYIFIVPRKNFENIGGFDENITDWDEENMDFNDRLYARFGESKRLNNYLIWSLFYEKVNYPLYMKGINVEKILKMKYPLGDMSWNISI